MRSALRKTWTLQIQSSLDGSQGFYCAVLPCQQCQCVHVCDCVRIEDLTLHNDLSKLHPTQQHQNPDPKNVSTSSSVAPERKAWAGLPPPVRRSTWSPCCPDTADQRQTAPPAGQCASLHRLYNYNRKGLISYMRLFRDFQWQ